MLETSDAIVMSWMDITTNVWVLDNRIDTIVNSDTVRSGDTWQHMNVE